MTHKEERKIQAQAASALAMATVGEVWSEDRWGIYPADEGQWAGAYLEDGYGSRFDLYWEGDIQHWVLVFLTADGDSNVLATAEQLCPVWVDEQVNMER